MLNIKKVILFLIVGVFLIGLSNLVLAEQSGKDTYPGFTANITEIARITGISIDTMNRFDIGGNESGTLAVNNGMFGEVTYLKNASSGLTYQVYRVNITVIGKNVTSDNIGVVNITLPVGLTFINWSNISFIGSGRVIMPETNIGFSVTNLAANQQAITWSATGFSLTNSTDRNMTFSFNVTVLPAYSDGCPGQCLVNFTVGINSSHANHEYVIYEKVYIDGKLPTFTAAKTNDTTHLNATFSENINFTSLKTNSFNVTYTNRAYSNVSLTITAVSKLGGTLTGNNATEFTLTYAKIEANETPYITLHMSSIATITDLAGNAIAANTSKKADDGTPPTLLQAILDLNMTTGGNLTLTFDEPINISILTTIPADQLIIRGGKLAKDNFLNVTSPTTISFKDGDNTTIIRLSMVDAANISRWRVNTLYNISIANATFIIDRSGNPIRLNKLLESGGIFYNITRYINDTIKPTVTSFTYNHNTRQLIVGFDEPVDIPSMILHASLVLLNATTGKGVDTQDAIYIDQDFRQVNETSIVKSVVLNLSDADRDKIAEWNRIGITTLYLTTNNRTDAFNDMAGNYMYLITNSTTSVSAFGEQIVMSHTTWTKDTTAPIVLLATISDVNVTGPGQHRITIYFSENMTNTATVVLSKTISGTTTTLNTYNYSLPYDTSVAIFYYNFTAADTNAAWMVNITTATTAKDMSGNSITSDTGLNFTYDSKPPYIIYAYYLENGTTDNSYNGTLNIGDTLVLVFNEPLQSMSNVSLSKGNFTFRDNGDLNGNIDATISGNKITLNLLKAAPSNLNLRGEWVDVINGTLLQNITNRDLSANSSSWFIRDKADNFATNKTQSSSSTTSVTGPKTVIADYAVEVTNNSAMSISFPACVNTGNMSAYLPSTGYTFVSYYNAAQWTDTLVTALRPLVGYKFTWSDTGRYPSQDASDNIFRVYLKNQSDCELQSNEITIDGGWNYLALNGNYYTSKDINGRLSEYPDTWLADLNTGGATVNSIIKGSLTGNTTVYKNGVTTGGANDWDGLVIKPYEAWWVDASITSSTKPFTGVARW